MFSTRDYCVRPLNAYEEVILVHLSDCRSVFQVIQRMHIKFGMTGLELKSALEISYLILLDR
jgi:hypothetical protein